VSSSTYPHAAGRPNNTLKKPRIRLRCRVTLRHAKPPETLLLVQLCIKCSGYLQGATQQKSLDFEGRGVFERSNNGLQSVLPTLKRDDAAGLREQKHTVWPQKNSSADDLASRKFSHSKAFSLIPLQRPAGVGRLEDDRRGLLAHLTKPRNSSRYKFESGWHREWAHRPESNRLMEAHSFLIFFSSAMPSRSLGRGVQLVASAMRAGPRSSRFRQTVIERFFAPVRLIIRGRTWGLGIPEGTEAPAPRNRAVVAVALPCCLLRRSFIA